MKLNFFSFVNEWMHAWEYFKTNASDASKYNKKILCLLFHINKLPFLFSRRIWSGSERLGCRRCSLVQEVPTEWSDCDPHPCIRPLPPVAWEAVRRWADPRTVPHVHPVQGHEWGVTLSPGHACVQGGDWNSPSKAGLQNSEQTSRMNQQCSKEHNFVGNSNEEMGQNDFFFFRIIWTKVKSI